MLSYFNAPARANAGVRRGAYVVADAEGEPVAGDDAGEVQIWPLDALPALAFDHAAIIADYRSGRFRPGHARD